MFAHRLEKCMISLAKGGHLIVESYDSDSLDSLAALDEYTRVATPTLRHDFIPVVEIDLGATWRTYLYWAPAAIPFD